MNLYLLLLIPLLSALAVLLVPGKKTARWSALLGAFAQLALVLYLLGEYFSARNAGEKSNFLFERNQSWFSSLHIGLHVGVDGISLAMLVLTALVVVAGVLVSWRMDNREKEFFFLLIFLSLGAYGFFISLDLFTLFFFLELAVIPKLLLICIWGSGAKSYSAMKLALMLMAGSALVFVGLTGLYFKSGLPTAGLDLVNISNASIPVSVQQFFFPFLFVGFGIFGALFPFHTWVPDGHSSAPTAASMFLAGISMKLGGYGCLRVATYLLPAAAHYYSPLIILLSTVAIIYGAFATMMQKDLKYINAYSSVSHCGFVLLGIGMLTPTAITGAVMQMVSHGLMTALFFAAIGMVYERTHTRMVVQMGGLLKIMPFISVIFVIAGLCSLGLPGLSGFVAEMTVFMGAWQNPGTVYRLATVLACASIVVTAVYIMRAVGQVVMGPPKTGEESSEHFKAAWNEKLAAVLLVAGIVLIGMAPFLLNQLISPSTDQLMEHIKNGVSAK